MRYDVPLVPQTTGMGCWAASIAMILGWKNQASYDPSRIATNQGGLNYEPSLQSGLDPNDRYILGRNGFRLEPAQCYMPQAIRALLERFGPLWLAGWAPGPHIRVVTGFDQGQIHINDPWPVNTGARYSRQFQVIFGQMESLGAREMGEPNPVYVAHLAEPRAA